METYYRIKEIRKQELEKEILKGVLHLVRKQNFPKN